jgi:energy-coupling factor transporter transmembrane protein EcfT
MFQTMQAGNFAVVLYALFFAIIFPHRLYYLIAVGLFALAIGVWAVEYAPAFFMPIEFILTVVGVFKGLQSRVMSLSNGS